MRRDPRAYLSDVKDSASLISQFVSGKTIDDYQGDPLLRSAVERQFEVIGEALSQLSKTSPELAQQIPDLRRIVDFRNVLAHAYAVIDDDTVWQAIHTNLPQLIQGVSALLGGLLEDDHA
jgi:uncharacterized protein with HEPN domain